MYDHEITEWRRAVNDMSEAERDQAGDSHRAAIGLVGDRSDAIDEMRWGR
ncbi:microaggregate invasion protein 1 [Mycobacterium sp. LTG2003]